MMRGWNEVVLFFEYRGSYINYFGDSSEDDAQKH